jgi:hypothetical protein
VRARRCWSTTQLCSVGALRLGGCDDHYSRARRQLWRHDKRLRAPALRANARVSSCRDKRNSCISRR